MGDQAVNKVNLVGYTGFRWFVLITMIVATLGNGVTLIGLSPNIQDVANSLGVNLGQTSAIVMVSYNLACFVAGIFSGRFIDKFGAAKVYIVCFIVDVVVSLLYMPMGSSVAGLLIIRIIQGAMMVSIIGSAAAVAAVWFPFKERGIVTGLQAAAIALGVAVGMALSPRLTASTGSWQKGAAFSVLIIGVIAIVLSVIVVVAGKEPEVTDDEHFDPIPAEEEAKLYKQAFKTPIIFFVILVAIFFGWGFNVFNDLIPGYAAVDAPVGAGYGSVVAGTMLSMGSIAFMVGAIIAGMVIARIVKNNNRIPMCICFIIAAIMMFLLNSQGVIGSYGTMQVVVILGGFFLGTINPFNIGFVSTHYHPAICGRLGALVMAFTTIGGVIGLSVSSTCLSSTGFYHLTIILLGVACIIGAVFSLFENPKKVEKKEA